MNKKLIGIVAIFFVAILAMGTINAVDLSHHNFDNYFSMKVPKGVDFEKEDNSIYDDGFDAIQISYFADDFVLFYSDSIMYSEDNAAYFYQAMFQATHPDSVKCYESQDGDLRILEPTKNDEIQFSLVGLNEGNKFLVIAGEDVDLLKEMGRSVNFK